MGNKYLVGKFRLTAMQHACYKYVKDHSGTHSIDEIIRGVYSCYKNERCPDLWTYKEKFDNVERWCNTLVKLNLLKQHSNGWFSFNGSKKGYPKMN